MHGVAEKEEIVRVTVPGRGSYPSYKFIFTHTARTIEPDALRLHILEWYPDAEENNSLDLMDDYDLIAMHAWWKSVQIYSIYTQWVAGEIDIYTKFNAIDRVVGDRSWAPSIFTLQQMAGL